MRSRFANFRIEKARRQHMRGEIPSSEVFIVYSEEHLNGRTVPQLELAARRAEFAVATDAASLPTLHAT